MSSMRSITRICPKARATGGLQKAAPRSLPKGSIRISILVARRSYSQLTQRHESCIPNPSSCKGILIRFSIRFLLCQGFPLAAPTPSQASSASKSYRKSYRKLHRKAFPKLKPLQGDFDMILDTIPGPPIACTKTYRRTWNQNRIKQKTKPLMGLRVRFLVRFRYDLGCHSWISKLCFENSRSWSNPSTIVMQFQDNFNTVPAIYTFAYMGIIYPVARGHL